MTERDAIFSLSAPVKPRPTSHSHPHSPSLYSGGGQAAAAEPDDPIIPEAVHDDRPAEARRARRGGRAHLPRAPPMHQAQVAPADARGDRRRRAHRHMAVGGGCRLLRGGRGRARRRAVYDPEALGLLCEADQQARGDLSRAQVSVQRVGVTGGRVFGAVRRRCFRLVSAREAERWHVCVESRFFDTKEDNTTTAQPAANK